MIQVTAYLHLLALSHPQGVSLHVFSFPVKVCALPLKLSNTCRQLGTSH